MEPDAFDIIEKLDYIQPLAGGGVELYISPRRGRLNGSPEMLELLKKKIQFYLAQLNAQGFQAVFKHPRPDQTVIVLFCADPLLPELVELVARASAWVEKNNATLVLRSAGPVTDPDGTQALP